VADIENLPPSFEWRDQGASTTDSRSAAAIVRALTLQPGRTARVRSFRDPSRAERFADFLDSAAEVPTGMVLEVNAHGRDVYASLTPRSDEAEPVAPVDPDAGDEQGDAP
jgi:hypothetical protein